MIDEKNDQFSLKKNTKINNLAMNKKMIEEKRKREKGET